MLTAGSGASWRCRYLRDSPAPRLAVPLRLPVPGGAGAVAAGRGGPRSPVHLSHAPRLPSQPFAGGREGRVARGVDLLGWQTMRSKEQTGREV